MNVEGGEEKRYTIVARPVSGGSLLRQETDTSESQNKGKEGEVGARRPETKIIKLFLKTS